MRSRLAAGLAAALLLVVPEARAFERSTVDGDPSTPLFWRHRTVLLRPAYDTSHDVSSESVRLALARAIATWNEAAEPCSDFQFEDRGYPNGYATNMLGGEHDGENRIVFREDEWPEDMAFGTIAVTTMVYRRASGQILDADIDLNAVDYVWTDTNDPALAQTDVQNALTHELGHVLGLAHADDPEATMWAESPPGDLEKRSLAEDDVAGLCYVYPEGVLTPGAPLLMSPPLTGCTAVGARGGAPAAAIVILLVRRRRGARRSARPGGTACAAT
ncbi:MAG TPA: matrixin family metalloprotease [Sandaracinaceae bacterium]